ncbi:unnamed protein product, partial [Musa acuminata subsp. burmannicoides]
RRRKKKKSSGAKWHSGFWESFAWTHLLCSITYAAAFCSDDDTLLYCLTGSDLVKEEKKLLVMPWLECCYPSDQSF